MVYSNLDFSHDSVDGEDNPYATFDRDTEDYQDHEDDGDFQPESAIHSLNHKDFDKLVEEEGIHQDEEENDDLHRESAIHSLNHEDFDKLVVEEAIRQNPEDNDDSRKESVIHSTSHENFDKVVQGEEMIQNYDSNAKPHQESQNDGEIEFTNTVTGLRSPTPSDEAFPKPVARTGDPNFGSMVLGNIRAPSMPKEANPQFNSNTIDTFATSLVLICLVVLVLALSTMAGRRRSRKRRRDVYSYLTSFDVEDVQLQRAITGGWHGTYKNGLAEGFDFNPDYNSDDYGETDEDSFDESYNDSYSDSFDDSEGSFNPATSGHTLGSGQTIWFHDEGDLSSFQVADKNIYFSDDIDLDDIDDDLDDLDDELDDDENSEDSDVFAPVRTRSF